MMKCYVFFYYLCVVIFLIYDLWYESIYFYFDIWIFDYVRKFGNINFENLWLEVCCFELIKIVILK